MIIHRATLLFFSLITLAMALQAKGVQTVEGTYTFYAPSSMSVQQAEQEAVRRAQIKALADAFGRVIVENTISVLTEQDEHFYQVGNSLVKGEWIETIGTPKIERGFYDDGICITCTIKGKAREIVISKTDVDVKILCNHPDAKYEHTDFKVGDKLYMSFSTAEIGYVAVYLYDKENDKVMCLLPYLRDCNSVCSVQKDKKYVFFSKAMNELPVRAMEYKMGCNDESTVNTLYVLFSKREFDKPMLKEGENSRSVPSISYDKFQKWLTRCQMFDDSFMVIKRNITISKN